MVMARQRRLQQLEVWMNGEHVGRWAVSKKGLHTFAYSDTWRASAYARPISLSIPLEQDASGAVVERYFDNLLPDNKTIRTRLQGQFSTESTQAFDLLAELGRDCVGALQLLTPDTEPQNIHRIEARPLTSEDIVQILTRTLTAGRHQDNDDFRISVAGAQEKTALLYHEGQWLRPIGATPTTHLLKLPIGKHNDLQIDLGTSVDNEWICAHVLAAYGIPVASCKPVEFGDYRVLSVTRFDRTLSHDGTWLVRLPQEDLCQAFGLDAAAKYEDQGGPGIDRIMKLLLASSRMERDRLNFFKTQVVFWMLAAIDGHAKNFSIFLEPKGRFSLTPQYDVLSAHPYMRKGEFEGINKPALESKKIRMAMAWSGRNKHYRWSEIEPRHFLSSAKLCGLSSDSALGALRDIVEHTPEVLLRVPTHTVGAHGGVLERILLGLAEAADRIRRGLV